MKRKKILIASLETPEASTLLEYLVGLQPAYVDLSILTPDTNALSSSKYYVFPATLSRFKRNVLLAYRCLRMNQAALKLELNALNCNLKEPEIATFDCILVTDLELLPLFHDASDRVVWLADKLYCEPTNDSLRTFLSTPRECASYLERYARKVRAVLCEGKVLASRLKSGYDISANSVLSIPHGEQLGDVQARGRETLRIACIIGKHFSRDKLHFLADYLTSYRLSGHIYLIALGAPNKTLKAAIKFAQKIPEVTVLAAPESLKLSQFLSYFHVGLYFSHDGNTQMHRFSSEYFYFYLLAALPVLAIGEDEQTEVVKHYQLGVTIYEDDYASLHQAIQQCLPSCAQYQNWRSAVIDHTNSLSKKTSIWDAINGE